MARAFSVARLRAFAISVFSAAGLGEADAQTVADVLVHADLRGHGSHGLTRIPIYAKRIVAGAVKARPQIRIERPSPGFLHVDGDNGPGPVVTLHALEAAIAAAREQGVVATSIAHSNHNGAGSFYVEKAIEAGCLAFAMTNAPPSMAVFGGREAVIGTNPITFGAPTTSEAPLLLDMATSVVARGKIVEGAKRGETIPAGWALDRDGRPTTDAAAAEKGVVLPFGGAKGSALAIMVEVLTGVLAGGRFAGSMGNLYSDYELTQDVGHFLLVVDLSRTHLGPAFAQRTGALVAELEGSAPAEGFERIRMPGEVEAERARDVAARGIALPNNVVADLDAVAREVGVDGLSAGAGSA
ncbi:Ldh family oxidoreductase [Salinarimonas sp. NSM]|uniref:Ldh family oxidoreductase n=1 Tax=Salinarimonas sp. NSM TaxID=3458003 RepID=UPI004035F6B8